MSEIQITKIDSGICVSMPGICILVSNRWPEVSEGTATLENALARIEHTDKGSTLINNAGQVIEVPTEEWMQALDLLRPQRVVPTTVPKPCPPG